MAICTPSSDAKDEGISLARPSGLVIKSTPSKGRGVFTSQLIPSGTVIDICSVLVLDPYENIRHIEHTSLYHYTYNWPLSGSDRSSPGKTQAVVFGLGSMFNHSTEDQNVGFTRDVEKQVVMYRALRDIHPGEELCISYGDNLTFEDADKPSIANGTAAREEDEDEMLGRIQLGT